jgi:hypothetical protein
MELTECGLWFGSMRSKSPDSASQTHLIRGAYLTLSLKVLVCAALTLSLVPPGTQAVGQVEQPPERLYGILLTTGDLGPSWTQIDLLTDWGETDSFMVLQYVFVLTDGPTYDAYGSPVSLLAGAALPLTGDLPTSFETFVDEVIRGEEGIPSFFEPAEGPRVGDESLWWRGSQPRITGLLLATGELEEPTLVPYDLVAVAFRQGDSFGFVMMAGPPELATSQEVSSRAAVMVQRMRRERDPSPPRPVVDCYVDPAQTACEQVPLPVAVAQRGVDIPIIVPCNVPESLNPEPEARLRHWETPEGSGPPWVEIMYWPAVSTSGVASPTLYISEQRTSGSDGFGPIGTHSRVGDVDVTIQGGEQGSGTTAVWRAGDIHYSLSTDLSRDEALAIVHGMVLGCDR